jgi:flagellar hook-associated protein 2
MNQVAALINARSQAVAGYDAASVEYDSQEGTYFLRLTAEESSTTGALTQTLTAGDAIDELHDETDWNKTAAGAGAFVYTYDGTTRTINVSSDTTLEGLRDLINNDALNPGVTASILAHDGGYHLVLAGEDTGTDYAIAIDDFETTLNGFDTGDFTESQQAQNSKFRVDGYPADPNWMERSSNTVTDVLPGVTLRLLSAGTSTVTLSRDTATLKDELHAFVAYYNEVVDLIAAYTDYDEANEARGLLQGDGTITRLLWGFRDDLVSQVAGFVEGAGSDTFTLAVQLGLTIDREGHLELDETVYDEAMATDYLGALSLVGERNSGASDSSYLQFVSASDDTRAGVYEVEVDFDAGGAVIAARIRTEGESVWRALTIFDNRLEGAEGTDEEGLVLTAVWDGVSSTQSADVRVKRGFACAIHDELEALLDSVAGPVQLKTDQFADTIEQIEKNIERQEQRITEMEARLKEKYARLETTLAALDSQRSSLEAILESMANMWGRNN